MEPTPRSRREIEEAKRLDHDLQALDQGAVGLDTIKAFALPGADEVVPEVEPGVPPWARAIKRKPRPDSDVRQSLRVMARTPPMLWAVEGETLSPMLPTAPQFMAKGPVRGVPDVPAVIGRVVNHEDGPVLSASMPLMRRPPPDVILRRVLLEWRRLRRRERRLSLEDTLRERSEVLYRSAFEWLYMTQACG